MPMCTHGCHCQRPTKATMVTHRKASHPTALAPPVHIKKTQAVACNDCRKTFASIDALRQHQHTMPNHIQPATGIGSLSCDNCSRTFKSQDALEQHFVDYHSLIQLPKGDSVRAQLEKDFKENWRKESSRPGRVLSIFRVYNPCWRKLEFEQRRKQLPHGGNEVQRYHGTTQLCDLGRIAKSSKLCQNDGCNLCSILRTGFKMAKVRRSKWQRFGPGIYTTATSGKSNDYIKTSSKHRAVLVCQVLAGKVYPTKTSIPTLEAPPPGYHSVAGEVGKDLNYDETVVYSSKAILPCYMIVYVM